MHSISRPLATLTGVVITLERAAPLARPIRATVNAPAVDILRVAFAMAVIIPALAATVFPSAFMLGHPGIVKRERCSAAEADKSRFLFGASFDCCILTCPAAMLGAAMLGSCRLSLE